MTKRKIGLVSLLTGVLLLLCVPGLGYGQEAGLIASVRPAFAGAEGDAEPAAGITYGLGVGTLVDLSDCLDLDVLAQAGYDSNEMTTLQFTGRLRRDVPIFGKYQPYLYFGGIGLDIIILPPGIEPSEDQFEELGDPEYDYSDTDKWTSAFPMPLDLRLELIGGGASWTTSNCGSFSLDWIVGYLFGFAEGTYIYKEWDDKEFKHERETGKLYEPAAYVAVTVSVGK